MPERNEEDDNPKSRQRAFSRIGANFCDAATFFRLDPRQNQVQVEQIGFVFVYLSESYEYYARHLLGELKLDQKITRPFG